MLLIGNGHIGIVERTVIELPQLFLAVFLLRVTFFELFLDYACKALKKCWSRAQL